MIKNIASDLESKNNDFKSKLDKDVQSKIKDIEKTKLNKSEFSDISSKVNEHQSKIESILD